MKELIFSFRFLEFLCKHEAIKLFKKEFTVLRYPMKFNVKSSSKSGISQQWSTSAEAMPEALKGAIPPEFGGPGQGYSPEDFYALAIANCFVATFKVYAEKSRLDFEDLHVDVTLEVDRDEKGFPWMARAFLNAKIVRPSSKENAENLMNKAFKGCLVMNSIKTEKITKFEVVD